MTAYATPDNLAKLARLIAIRQPLNEDAVSEAIDLCVAEWRSDRKRMEAADRLRRAAYACLESEGFDAREDGRGDGSADCDDEAALAAGEKP